MSSRAVGAIAASLALTLALAAPAAQADGRYPTRGGETGFVEVPSAEVVGTPGSMLGADLRLDAISGEGTRFGPFPIYGVAGLLPRLELGFGMRQWGRPGDELPQRTSVAAAAKFQLVAPSASPTAVAVDVTGDQLNVSPIFGSRVIVSGDLRSPLRYGVFAGGELGNGSAKSGFTVGGALGVQVSRETDLMAEALWDRRGTNAGAAVRRRILPGATLQLGVNYLPGESGLRVSIGILLTPPRAMRTDEPPTVPGAENQELITKAAEFRDDRPHFRLRFAADGTGTGRHAQYGPFVAASTQAPRPAPTAGPQLRAAASLDDLAEAQLREQEALVDARERRIRSTADQLDAREKTALSEAKRLEDLEKTLAVREKELDAREQRIVVKGPASPQQRQLESLEAQLAAQERTLAAQERTFGPAIDAATGRATDAAGRESVERQEASRLSASVSGAANRTQQIELRKQVLGARNRQLAAFEARLVARGERIDAVERQDRAKAERLDAWARRLDTRAERLELLERRASESAPKPAAAPKPVEAKPAAAKDKAVFVMVVKSPTAIVKERSGAAPSGAPLAAGVAVEKAVAAATVVTFPSPASTLSELDRETIDNIAQLAAKESCEILIWARAKDPSMMAEAQRRAGDLKARVVASGPLPEQRVVTRITTRPGAQGVDVVVSALRETAKPAPAAGAGGSAQLEAGEGGKRQIREAVQAAQPLIEGCIGEHIQARRLQRAEGTLKLTVTAQGKVQSVRAVGSDLGSEALDACLAASSGKWQFPSAEAEYVVDVPITVVQGGGTR